MMKDAVPKERKELDYGKLTQMITKILDERKEAESIEVIPDHRIPFDETTTRSDNKIIKGLLVASLALNILLLSLWLFRMIVGSGFPF
jgi:hypothetical protein